MQLKRKNAEKNSVQKFQEESPCNLYLLNRSQFNSFLTSTYDILLGRRNYRCSKSVFVKSGFSSLSSDKNPHTLTSVPPPTKSIFIPNFPLPVHLFSLFRFSFDLEKSRSAQMKFILTFSTFLAAPHYSQ